ncbi:hypothetical protein [Marinithermofilum abyssi]|nr:hypothetical protein [Marinithermofilum abyssi]
MEAEDSREQHPGAWTIGLFNGVLFSLPLWVILYLCVRLFM